MTMDDLPTLIFWLSLITAGSVIPFLYRKGDYVGVLLAIILCVAGLCIGIWPEPDQWIRYGALRRPHNVEATRSVARDGHTAIYDIHAHLVYLPDGDALEAHSGLGYMMDDPQFVDQKGQGPAPPNLYRLELREQLFHGVQAIRLEPVGDGDMFGRTGILAHPYMRRPGGQSSGCVAFRNYHRFLRAFLDGEIDRLRVVPYAEDNVAQN